MFETTSPRRLLEHRVGQVLELLAGVRDGNDTAIHDTRVATRRAREALVVGRGEYEQDVLSEIAETLQRTGRALGAVRDPDALHALLVGLESRFPLAGAAVSQLHAAIARERQIGRRKLIKTLEALDLAAVPQRLRRARHRSRVFVHESPWRKQLRGHLAARASELQEAIEHGTGVYFPNRSHSTRIGVKKLRYAVELSRELQADAPQRVLRHLKKAQQTLGEMRDRQVLIDRLQPFESAGDRAGTTINLLEAEILALHERYVALRPDLVAACRRVETAAQHRPVGLHVAAAAVVVPSLFVMGRRLAGRDSRTDSPHTGTHARNRPKLRVG